MTRMIRGGVGFLAGSQILVGGWALFFPTGFFSLEVVGMAMPYNEHLMRDYGAMTLASALVLGTAVFSTGHALTRVALAMYLVWAGPHAIVHLTMLDRLAPTTATLLITGLTFVVALPATLLALTYDLAGPGFLGESRKHSKHVERQ